MRKVIIILAALAITGLAYWGYVRLSGSATLEPPTTYSSHELELSETVDNAQRIGQTVPIRVDDTYYVTRDPITRQVTRVFGFSRLNNPGSQSAYWEVEKPFIIFYESAYQCRIDADNGLFQTERIGANVAPRDGQLEGNVVIHITPRSDSRMAETTLYLDDLLFSSERTEFSTDGPVRVASSQIELSGRGMVLLINAVDGQVEYLHILDLESLAIRDFVQTEPKQAASTTRSPVETPTHRASIDKAPIAAAATEKDAVPAAADESTADQEEVRQRRLYQCVIEDNVMIRYGDQIVVAGADQVNIQNILLTQQQEAETPASEPMVRTHAVSQDSADVAAAAPSGAAPEKDTDSAVVEKTDRTEMARDESRDVIITCDGGIIIKPMPTEGTGVLASAPAIEMNGTPLRIEQVDPQSPEQTQPLAHCGLLLYDMETDVLRLFSDTWRGDILLGGGTAGRIETQGPVVWDRRRNQAQIAGPGIVYFDGGEEGLTEAGQMAFAGLMELFFADAPAQASALHLAAANLTGGMSTQFRGDGALMTAAETAYLSFGPQNALASARLEGEVRFDSADGESASSATAHTAVFHFDENRQLARSDLAGDVRFASGSGRLHTDKAVIAFAADQAGAIQPTQFDAVTEAILETHDASSKQPPARFEARSIRYDLLTGSGHAVGPVRFVFYQAADPNDGLLTEYWPVEITADGDAEFVAGDNRQIETVIFNRNVNGVQTLQYAAYIESNAFHSETMIVKLVRSAEGSTDIQSIVLRDGDVYAESKRTHEMLKLGHTRLSCREIVYDRQTERIVAVGPGQIELDNSQAEPVGSSDGLDLRGPSFARIREFDRIEWSSDDRRIIAEGKANVMQLDYVPLVDGVPSRHILAAAGRVEMELTGDADGKTQLTMLTATDHVYFEERGKHILQGHTLVYDAANDGWLSIVGTDDRPCMADGARVPYIHYNATTGQLETRLSTIPGAVTIPQ